MSGPAVVLKGGPSCGSIGVPTEPNLIVVDSVWNMPVKPSTPDDIKGRCLRPRLPAIVAGRNWPVLVAGGPIVLRSFVLPHRLR